MDGSFGKGLDASFIALVPMKPGASLETSTPLV